MTDVAHDLAGPATKAWVLATLGGAIGLMVLVSWTLVTTWYSRVDHDINEIKTSQTELRREIREDNRRLEGYILQLMRERRLTPTPPRPN